jgi:hypothetical protein
MLFTTRRHGAKECPALSGICSSSLVTAAAPGSFRGGLIVSTLKPPTRSSWTGASTRVKCSTARPSRRQDALAARTLSVSYRSYVSFEDPDGNVWIVQEVTRRLPGRIDPAMTTFASANDLASAMRRAAEAHGEHEKHNGQRDANWPDWYAAYMAAEQVGSELPM